MVVKFMNLKLTKAYINQLIAVFICSLITLLNVSCAEHLELSEDEIRKQFIHQAQSANWYIVGSKVFQNIGKRFDKSIVPKLDYHQTKKGNLLSAHHFKNLIISSDGLSFMAMSQDFKDTSPMSAHLIIFDIDFKVVFEDENVTFVGNKGKNTLSSLRWSYDQKYIAYAQNKNIWLIDIKNNEQVSIASDHQRDLSFSAPNWSKNSQELIYENDKKQVVIINIETQKKDVLVNGRFPQWSPDGELIVYRNKTGQVIIYSLALDREIDRFSLQSHHPDYLWTPDSQYIIIAQKIHNSYKSNYFVYSLKYKKIVNLNHRYEKLDIHQIQSLPKWLESKQVKLRHL